ncbi:TonB-dependent receptor [Shewanella sp. UCD-KL12]|uniref:TonB-dependent receptor n=1 Tax=Shewanella sp. UCD-KL12 TaxID=1917163 RepID=UPI0009708D66|nr:TonB-dependent receptor [Shewanella sp. UCD-KL12]
MENRKFNKRLIATALLCSPMLSTAYADDNIEQVKSIEVITVHGEKVERSLKDTTSSVSVIDKETLDSGQYLSVNSALSEIPNVVALSGSVPDIRGVTGNGAAGGFNSFTGGAKARVSTLVDGVAEPFVADLTGDTGLWDIQQIEVFRGPQSTINGRNSIGGTVFIKTLDPTFDWSGAARIGYRDQDNYIDSAVMLSGPIMDDQLAFRLTGQNVTGENFSQPLNFDTNPATKDTNELKTNRWRAKLLWEPTALEALKVLYSYSYNNEKGNTGRQFYTADDPWAFKPISSRYMDTKSNTHSLKFDYQLSEGQSLDLLVAYMDYQWGFESYEAVKERQQNVVMDDKSYTVDGKYSFGLNDAVLNGFVGLAYYERTQDFNSVGGFTYGGDDSSTSQSVYGEITYAMTPVLKLTVGGRVMHDEQTRNFAMQMQGEDIDEKLDTSNTVTLPKLVLQYAVSDNTTLAASARKGYNAGGGALSFDNLYYYYDEESVDTYELSSRSSFNGGNINLSANLFYNNFDGYQASNSERRITNIDEAVTSGLEVELNAMLSDNWQLLSGLGLLQSEIKSADPSYGDIIGNELNSTPGLTANLGVKYWFSDELTFGMSGNYVGEYYSDINNSEERIAGDYVISRINIDYQNDAWRISGFVNNLFDEQAITVTEPAGRRYPDGYAAIVDPRNIGVNVTYSF